MSFYGKVYKSEKHENLEAFFKAVGTPDAYIPNMVNSEPTTKLTKNGDTYTLNLTGTRNSEITFTNGGEFTEKYNDKVTLTSKFTIEGNVLTQVQKISDSLVVTVTREFFEDSLKEKIQVSGWDGVAYRYFKV